jgi:hypothetical protein
MLGIWKAKLEMNIITKLSYWYGLNLREPIWTKVSIFIPIGFQTNSLETSKKEHVVYQ